MYSLYLECLTNYHYSEPPPKKKHYLIRTAVEIREKGIELLFESFAFKE